MKNLGKAIQMEDDLPEPEAMSEEERGGGVQKKLFSG